MSEDQFRRFRQVGTYGAYRVVFRSISGLTTGDGWTPDDTAHKLANFVNESLPRPAQLRQEQLEVGTKWGHWSGGGEARYWLTRGWETGWASTGGLLPTQDEAKQRRLTEYERSLLEPALFATDSTRRMTAEVLASAKAARTHAGLCDALANSSALSKKLEPSSLAPLPAFTRFADAAMHAMRGLWSKINHDDAKQASAIESLALSVELQSKLDLLRDAGVAWLNAPARSVFPHEQVVTRLAEAMRDATTPVAQIRALARHHHEHGGGRRWFREQVGRLVPIVADTGIAASDYRFRLRPLCRLAAQCGVANLTQALDAVEQQEPDDEEGDTL